MAGIEVEIRNYRVKNILLVTGRKAMKKTGILERIKSYLSDYQVIHFGEVEPNPSIQTVDRGLDLCQRSGGELVIGLGGGSPLDVAKAIAMLMRNPGGMRDYLKRKKSVKNKGLSFIALPTTSGTGSEVTPFSVITNRESKAKQSLGPREMFPDLAIVDPDLTLTLPPSQTASTGLDALSHAVEALWSRQSLPPSDCLATEAIRLIYDHLKNAFQNGNDPQIREKMSLASLLAGMAFSNTGTTGVHVASYPLTVDYGVTHGFACALLLAPFMEYNLESIKGKFDRIALYSGMKNTEGLIQKLYLLLEELGAPTRLRDIGVKEKDIASLAERGMGRKTANNPRKVTQKDLEKILRQAY